MRAHRAYEILVIAMFKCG